MPRRFVGIDTIRFLAALMVFFSHGGGLAVSGSTWLDKIYLASFNGRAAVIVFFVVSGFCIHAPNCSSRTLDVVPFYFRRLIRIGAPAGVLGLALWLVDNANGAPVDRLFWHGAYFRGLTSVAWSLIAEVSYYAAYPLIFLAARRWGMRSVLVASVIVAVILTVVFGLREFMWQYSVPVMCTLGLPFWLVGAFLAERISRRGVVGNRVMIWRVAVFAYLFIVQYLSLFSKNTLPDHLIYLPFAVIIYKWLEGELAIGAHRSVAPLEWAGTWSYSLYLTHKSLIMLCAQFVVPITGDHVLLRGPMVLIGAYLFGRCVETPAQQLASVVARVCSRAYRPIRVPTA